MINELIFALHVSLVSAGALFFTRVGKEALISYIALLFVVANIFVIKQINLFGFCVTSADAFIVGVSFSCNLLQEFWGKEWARKAIWISFACCLSYMLIVQTIMAYIPSSCDITHAHFVTITANVMRITMASFTAYLITQFVDMHLYAYLKLITNGKYFVARNYLALGVSQALDTILFSYLGLWGIVNNIQDIMIISYAIKILAILLSTPFLFFAKRLIHQNN